MSDIELYNLPMNVNAWLASPSVEMMTPAEEGAYFRLLCYCWKMNGLPDDDTDLARLSRLGEDWKKGSGEKIRKCFTKRRQKLFSKRLDSERKKALAHIEKSRRGGLASAKARKEKQLQENGDVKGGSSQVQSEKQPPSKQHNHNNIHNHNNNLNNSKHTHTTPESNSKPSANMDMNELKILMESLDMDLVNKMGAARGRLERMLNDKFKPVNGTRQVMADIVQLVVFQAAKQQSVRPFDEAMQWARNVFAITNLKNPTGMFVNMCKEKLGYVPRGMMLEK